MATAVQQSEERVNRCPLRVAACAAVHKDHARVSQDVVLLALHGDALAV
jgi:hypothetical protein